LKQKCRSSKAFETMHIWNFFGVAFLGSRIQPCIWCLTCTRN
jgi:hypothetical protein